MPESLRVGVEVTFNIVYLITVWVLVGLMYRRRSQVAPEHRPVARLMLVAFGLLALGDTGHVGFRVLAYARGGLDTLTRLWGMQVSLVGLGALSTAITVTAFYGVMLFIWQARYHRDLNGFAGLLLAATVARLVIMAFPQNQWSSAATVQPWSLYRNIPLMIQGLGVAGLILRDALAAQDRAFVWIGVLILVSYAFYTPVILWVQRYPLVGMLMIPKTVAYVGIALIAYRALYLDARAVLTPSEQR